MIDFWSAVVVAAQVGTVLWFVAFGLLIADQRRAAHNARPPTADVASRWMTGSARWAFFVGLGGFFVFSAVALLSHAVDLGIRLPA